MEKIKILLDKNVFLKKKTKEHIIKNYNSLSDEKEKNKIIKKLEETLSAQKVLIKEVFKKKPSFLKRLQIENQNMRKQIIKLKEVKNTKKESSIINDIENKLNNVNKENVKKKSLNKNIIIISVIIIFITLLIFFKEKLPLLLPLLNNF